LNIEQAVRQAEGEAGYNQWPAVAHRKNRTEWLVTMRAVDFFNFARSYWEWLSRSNEPI
jgi:hypothetical protein